MQFHGVASTRYNCICILVLTTLKMATWVAGTCRCLLCNKITCTNPNWSIALYGAETWALRAVDQKHLVSFEMRCWRWMKISWTDHVRNEVLLRVKEQRNILHEISKSKANWIGHILRRNCLLQQVIEGKIKGWIEATGRRRRRRRKLLDDLKERRRYSHLKEEALDRTMWRTRFGRGFGPVVRQTTKWTNPSEFVGSVNKFYSA
jgi:hypothetical protein